jgi:hypothetical protein
MAVSNDDLRTTTNRFEHWWTGENDKPLLFYQYPESAVNIEPFRRPWSPEPGDASWQAGQIAFDRVLTDGDRDHFDTVLELAEAQTNALGFLGAGFPRYFPNLGPGIVAAYISGYSRLMNGINWFELGQEKPRMSLEQIREACDGDGGTHAELTLVLVERAARRFAGRLPVSMTDLGGNLDLLSALHGATELMRDSLRARSSASDTTTPTRGV